MNSNQHPALQSPNEVSAKVTGAPIQERRGAGFQRVSSQLAGLRNRGKKHLLGKEHYLPQRNDTASRQDACSTVSTVLTAMLIAALGASGCSSDGGSPSPDTPDASVTSLTTAQKTTPTISPAAKRLITDLRASFVVPTPPESPADELQPPDIRDAMKPKAHALLGTSNVRRYEKSATSVNNGAFDLVPKFPKGARAGVLKPSKVRLGSVATQVARVEDESTGAWISVRWMDAKEQMAEHADGYLVYRDVLGAGSAALTRGDVTGAEHYVNVPAAGPAELRYVVHLGDQVAGLRQVKGSEALEFLDEEGAPRLRMIAPMALAGTDKIALHLDVSDCVVDTNPKAPWGRAVTDPGKRDCEVRVSWDGTKVQGVDVLVDPAWTTTGSMADGRHSHTASTLSNGRVLVAGGDHISSAELYDPSSGTWSTTGSMAKARADHTASVLSDGRVLIAGGRGNGTLWSAELYDPSSGTWSKTGSMAKVRRGHTASVLSDGRVLVAGGIGNGILASVELYDPTSGTWSKTGSMAQGREQHTASVLSDGRVLVVGGRGEDHYLVSAELYDPSSGSWSTTGSMAQRRIQHTASVLSDGRVLVVGGLHNAPLASTELYDLASGTWTTSGTVEEERGMHTASVLSDGRVLITGGWDNGSLASAELYDPSSNTWSSAGSMADWRKAHTASVLSDGQVLVVGGLNSTGSLASAELFAYGSSSSSAGSGSDQGCGCSVPGRQRHGDVPWQRVAVVALVGLAALRRRRE